MNVLPYRMAGHPPSPRALPQVVRQPAGQVQDQRLSTAILLQIALIDLVSGGMVALGYLQPAAWCMWGMIGMALLRLVLLNRHLEVACLLIGVAPLVNLLRGAALYSGVPLLYIAGVGYVACYLPARTRQLFQQLTLPSALLGLSVLYYFVSAIWTLDQRQNIRVLELASSAVLICYLAARKDLLQSAIAGLLISALVVGVSAFPHLQSRAEERLGLVAVENLAIGNPFTSGTPLALGVLAICLDRGRWMGLANRPTIRLMLLAPTVVLLALSTSRASWLITVAGLVVGTLIGRRQRFAIVLAILTVALAGLFLTTTPLAEPFVKGLNRTFDKDRDASTGRADQWKIFLYAFTDSPKALLIGYGPGNGPSVFAEYSSRTPGIELHIGSRIPFHGLLMHIGAEWGLTGLIPLGIWLFLAARKALSAFVRTGLVLPVTGLMGFVLASLTVTGFDTVSGTFLGLGLIADRVSRLPQRVQQAKTSQTRHRKFLRRSTPTELIG